MKCAKDETGYYSDMLNELARIDNTTTTKLMWNRTIEKARKAKVRFHEMILTIDGFDINCIGCYMNGGVKTLKLVGGLEAPVSEYQGSVKYFVKKSIKDYATQPNIVGQYKYCEGGGWYSMANLYELNGKYYIDAY